MQEYVDPSGSTSEAAPTSEATPSLRARYTKAILVSVVLIAGLLLGIYIGMNAVKTRPA
jgi:F0F1-type ATP synthase assembly protein I